VTDQEMEAQAAAYLITLEEAVPNTISLREALLRAFEAGRFRGRPEGVAMAQEIMTRQT
jgi:hypothetical protein